MMKAWQPVAVSGANRNTLSHVVVGLMGAHGVLLGGHRSFLLPFVLFWGGCQDHTATVRSSHLLGGPGSRPCGAHSISRRKERGTAGNN